jgi:arylsulfatase A|tara:strand:+ start:5068 stop:6501 length:1434 start_codon:yes stop_codon:yes gene_type:complete
MFLVKNKIFSIKLFIYLFVLFSLGCDKKKQVDKPNIIFILADDMGYADFELIGKSTKTPNLNNLANEGIFFKNFYAAGPNCSPSRVGFMTGKSPAKVGMYSYRPPDHPLHLPENEITLPEILKSVGYKTAHFGKWHLGCLPQNPKLNHPQPNQHGFDFSFGTENNAIPSHLNPINFIKNGEKVGEVKGYSCQILAQESINWIEKNKEDPFFLYIAFHEPHTVIASPPNLVRNYKNESKKDREYLANIDNLDLAIGKVLKYLNKKKLDDNTIIIFSSDNGSYRAASNGTLRAVKSYLYEGGIKVPGIISWSKLKTSKRVVNTAAGLVDILPTLCDILKIAPPNDLDGSSLLPILNGKEFKRNKPLYWFFYRTSPEIAIRLENHMLFGVDDDSITRTHRFSSQDLDYIKTIKLNNYELFDLINDHSQEKNIFANHKKKDSLKLLIDNKLKEIQDNLYPWDNLPAENNKPKRLKKNWVKY